MKLPFISQYAATKERIEAEIPVYVETDGEELGHSPIDIEMLTRSLKIISGIKNRVV